MVAKPTQSREGVKGQLPLAGCRDSVPAGVWGNAPTVPRATNSKEAANKGAGSEASLAVTLRVLRRASKLLFRPIAHCRARWARPDCWSFSHTCAANCGCFFPQAGDFVSAEATKGFPLALWKPSARSLPCSLTFIVAGEFASAGATSEQQRHYPFLKYSPLCCTIPSAFCTIAGRRCWVMSASMTS